MAACYLVTGALGCLGSWTIAQLVEAGHRVVAVDLGTDRSRLQLVSGGTELEEAITMVRADVTDLASLRSVATSHGVERVIHLAAIQVPGTRADPPLGARVNVVGTTNVLEVARLEDLESVVFASSVAVYGPELADLVGSVGKDAGQNPNNLYGVFKSAGEAVAELYLDHFGVRSVGLRPHSIYGPGRDVGLTSAPTWAMFATARGEDYEIPFSGRVGLQFAPDVAQTFIRASLVQGDGGTYSIRGEVTDMAELARRLNARPGAGTVTVAGDRLPFPADLDESGLVGLIGEVPSTGLDAGIEATIEHFSSADPAHLPALPGKEQS